VKEPVHDHEQHDDREQTRGGLNVEAGAAHGADDRHRGKPGRDAGAAGHRGPGGYRPSQRSVGAEEARGHGGEDKDALQTLAEHEQGAVDDDGAVAQSGPVRSGIGDATGRADGLPRQEARHDEGAARPSGTKPIPPARSDIVRAP
jgi:hypothetical protein